MAIFIADVETIDRGGPLRRAAFDRTGVTHYAAIEVKPGHFLVVCSELAAAPAGTYDLTNRLTQPITNAQANVLGSRLGVAAVTLRGLTVGELVLQLTSGVGGAVWQPHADGKFRIALDGVKLFEQTAIQGGATDSFTYSNGRLSTVSSSVWTDSSSNMAVSANAVTYSAANSTADAFHATQLGSADHYGMADIKPGSVDYAGGGIIVRGNGNAAAGSATGYRCEFGCWTSGVTDHFVGITRLDGGATTEVAVANQGTEDTTAHAVRAEVSANTITIDVDGLEELVYSGATTYTTQKYVGLYAGRYGGNTVTIDNFESGTLGGAVSHAVTASGAATTNGAAPINIAGGPVSHAVAASGAVTADGAAPVNAKRPLAAAGAATTNGAAPISIPAASSVVASDDFQSYSDGVNWLPQTGWSETAANWKIYDPGGGGNKVVYPPGGQTIVTYDVGVADQAAACAIKSVNGMLGGPVARVADINNMLLLEHVTASGENAIKLYLRSGATWTELDAAAAFGFANETFYSLRLEAVGLNVRGYVNDVEVLSATLTSGQAATLGTRAGLFAESSQPNFGEVQLSTIGATAALAVASSGAATTGGAAPLSRSQPIGTSGFSNAATTNGAAPIGRAGSIIASGAAVTNGAAPIKLRLPVTATGAATTNGNTPIGQKHTITAAGAATTDGAADIRKRATLATSGDATTNGAAPLYLATGPVYVYAQGVSNNGSNSNPYAYITPNVFKVDDLVVMFIGGVTLGTTITAPAGWINPLGGTAMLAGTGVDVGILTHRVTAGELSQPYFQAIGALAATYNCTVGIYVLRNARAGTGVDSIGYTVNESSVTPHTLAGVSPTVGDGKVVSAVVAAGSRSYGTVSGWTGGGQAYDGSSVAIYQRDTLTDPDVGIAGTSVTPNTAAIFASATVVVRNNVERVAVKAAGAAVTDGAAPITLTVAPIEHAVTATGAATSTGDATLQRNHSVSGTSVSVTSGAAPLAVRRPLQASGASTTSGASPLLVVHSLITFGVANTGGSAVIAVTSGAAMTAAGAATANGAAPLRLRLSLMASGLVVVGGAARLKSTNDSLFPFYVGAAQVQGVYVGSQPAFAP